MKKGFTLIELLAVIVILAVIALIATPIIMNAISLGQDKAYKNNEYAMTDAAIRYLSANDTLVPKGTSSVFIKLSSLVGESYLKNIFDPKSKTICDTTYSGVKITNDGLNNYTWTPYLNCDNYKGDTENPSANISVVGNQLTLEAYDLNNLTFNGTNSYIQLPNINNIKAIEIKLYPISSYGYILDGRPGIYGSYIYSQSFGSEITKFYADGKSLPLVYTSIPKNQLTNIYIEYLNNFSDNVNIFSRYSNNEFHAGKIFEIRVWSKAFTESEIIANKDILLPDNTEGLLAYYKINDGYGTKIIDYSGNNNHATVINPNWKINSGVKEIRIKQNSNLITSSTNAKETFNLSPGTYTVEVEDYVGRIMTTNVTI